MTPETLDDIAVRVAQHIARAGDDATVVLARAHAATVAAFAHGNTRLCVTNTSSLMTNSHSGRFSSKSWG